MNKQNSMEFAKSFEKYFNVKAEQIEKYFYGIKFRKKDVENLNKFMQVMKLKSEGLSPLQIANKTKISKSTINKWTFNISTPMIIKLLQNYMKLGNPKNKKWLSINSTRGGLFTGPWILVPNEVKKYEDIKFILKQLKELPATNKFKKFGIEPNKINEMKPLFFAYVLGVMVGDASKDGLIRPYGKTRRISLSLTKRYPLNKEFGDFFTLCINSLGLRMKQIKDTPAGKKNTHGFYRWSSQCSLLIEWIFIVCLGLKSEELTTYNPIKANWLLESPKEFKIWFIQGIADSDGFIDFNYSQAGIIVGPNIDLIRKLFETLEITTSRKNLHKRTLPTVMIKGKDAIKLPIFNPFVKNYRYRNLKKMMNAKRYNYHWPEWVVKKIYNFTRKGHSEVEIIRKFLEEYDIFISGKNVRRRMREVKLK